WETVQVARHPNRPLASDYIDMIVKNFAEVHGDRRFADDKAVRCGMGRIGTEKIMLIAQQKGRDTKEKIRCNFGMMHPEGYRKAERCMKMAEKFRLPIVSLMDTAGAYPGIGSEERGVAEAIAHSMFEMSRLRTPVVCVVIGEGGSGGAIGIGIGDRMAMFQYAYYSVISPEGCAAILWRTGEKASDAADALGVTADRLQSLGVIDDIIAEPLGGAHRTPTEAAKNLERYVVGAVRRLKGKDTDRLLDERYKRWRKMGEVIELQLQTQAKAAAPLS
ncbi:MAG: acetyl-CoA carboxylase carboxyltransferase subunit alpha, partial [Planctomycetota bacterium]